jgi:hypothetical protein
LPGSSRSSSSSSSSSSKVRYQGGITISGNCGKVGGVGRSVFRARVSPWQGLNGGSGQAFERPAHPQG